MPSTILQKNKNYSKIKEKERKVKMNRNHLNRLLILQRLNYLKHEKGKTVAEVLFF